MSLKDGSQGGHLSLVDAAKVARPEVDRPAPADKVSVSAGAEPTAAITAAQLAAGSDRAKVVEAIANEVRQGTYKPDPQRIAQEILEDAELIARLHAMLNH